MATIRQRQYTYAITISTYQKHPHFVPTMHAELFIATLFRYRDAGKFKLHAFAVMPDHVHILITPSVDQSTSRCVQLIKGGYSHALQEIHKGEIWHPGHYDHRIRDEEDFHNQKLYIANNPVRKQLVGYPHVHTATRYAQSLDNAPALR